MSDDQIFLSDDQIMERWRLANRLWRNRFRRYRPSYSGPSLAERLAFRIVDDLEANGVTEADIDRLFPDTMPKNG